MNSRIKKLMVPAARHWFLVLAILALPVAHVTAGIGTPNINDPCGMVPPIYTGPDSPITRQGLQKTYVFYKDGVETFVIRPGFSGKVDQFGMLIPFPKPPAIRKVPDNVFEHISNAIDPPEVVIDLLPLPRAAAMARGGGGGAGGLAVERFALAKDEVRVLREEAVGMYEVAVLEAGSATALNRWMDQHEYQYPEGMDAVCEDYVQSGWCFVAVKTKVGPKSGVDPSAGQRQLQPDMEAGSVFDGHVQGMGFRFQTDELVVPMRLSTFNEGDTRNVVYLLTDGPRKIRAIPEEFVQRQLTGKQLVENLTQPLPVRIINGTEDEFVRNYALNTEEGRERMLKRRDPDPKMKAAKQLFTGDIFAVTSGQLSLDHEEQEKELLRIGEHFGLRGAQWDSAITQSLEKQRQDVAAQALKSLESMTMTVVDGDFPREVLSQQNLKFAEYTMPKQRNSARSYDAKQFGPTEEKEGTLKIGNIDWTQLLDTRIGQSAPAGTGTPTSAWLQSVLASAGLVLLVGMVLLRRRSSTALLLVAALTLLGGSTALAQEAETGSQELQSLDEIVEALLDSSTASSAIDAAGKYAAQGDAERNEIVKRLIQVAGNDAELTRRGWAIAAVSSIGGQDVDEYLIAIHQDEKQEQVVRNWAAAARVEMTRTLPGLLEKASLVQQFPALGRPIGKRIVEAMTSGDEVKAEDVLGITLKVPQLQQALAPSIMAFGPEQLTDVMVRAKDTNVRRQAAAYLGSLYTSQPQEVVASVVKALKFDAQADDLPWEGGALFVPGIQWGKEDATQLVGSLIRWHLWSDIRDDNQAQNQIHNNIRSLGLANAAGYQSPGWQNVGTIQWLAAWGQAVGKDEIRAILKEQGVAEDRRYQGVFDDF